MTENQHAESKQLIESCLSCGALLDVSEQEPFALVHCPSCGAQMNARTQFRNFKLISLIGQGGMGRVFKALDLNLHRHVAIKILRKEFSVNPEDVGRIEREARITASVNHPNVIKIYSFGSDHGQFYLAMELADKGSLDDLMALQGSIAEIQMLDVGIQVAMGLEAALNSGLIHRDVKPGNILFVDAHNAKIVDFGLALLMDEEAASRGEIWGTPYYIAPEKLDNRAEDFRSDIYSLGATLFHAVCGRPPYEANTASMVALKHLKGMPVSLQAFAPHVGGETTYVINRMLHKEPNQRYQSYAELIEHLRYAREQVAARLGRPKIDRHRAVVDSDESVTMMGWVSLALLLFVIAGIIFIIFNWPKFTTREIEPEPQEIVEDVRRAETKEEKAERLIEDFKAAKQQLAGGDFEPAYSSFNMLGRTPEAESFRLWCLAHEALCAFLTGRSEEAEDIISQKLLHADKIRKSGEAGLQALAEIARIANQPAPIPFSQAAGLESNGAAAFGLLLIGIKNWQALALDEGAAFIRAFLESNPSGEFAWISDYKAIVEYHLQDHELLVQARQIAQSSGGSRDDRARALQRVRNLKNKVMSGTEVLLAFEAIENQLRDLPPAQQPQTVRQEAKIKSLNSKASGTPPELKEAEELLEKARVTLDFRPVVDKFRAAATSSDGPTRELAEARAKSVEWLSEFIPALSQHIAAGADSGQIKNRSGLILGDRISSITHSGIKVSSQYGAVFAKWSEIDPAQIIDVARKIIASSAEGETTARLIWLTGVFAFEMGNQSLGRDLLSEAAAMSERYKNELSVYFDVKQSLPD